MVSVSVRMVKVRRRRDLLVQKATPGRGHVRRVYPLRADWLDQDCDRPASDATSFPSSVPSKPQHAHIAFASRSKLVRTDFLRRCSPFLGFEPALECFEHGFSTLILREPTINHLLALRCMRWAQGSPST